MILKVTITTIEVLTFTLVILWPLIKLIESFELSEEINCVKCIGGASLGIDTTKRCEATCGQYQLSYTYWADAGKPGYSGKARDFEKCAKDKACAEQTVRAYFKKYKRDCNGDGKIDCTDMAALHRGGPSNCNASWIQATRYWQAFNKSQCMDYKNNGLAGDQDYLIDNRAKNENLTHDCLDCICEAVSGCNMNMTNCNGGNVCGPFGISQAYWKDSKRPGANWVVCAKSKECSEVTMKNYMEKYKRDCNNDGVITCNDYAAIHRRGPQGCGSKDLQKDPYWHRFLTCRVNVVPSTDTNIVQLSVNNGNSGVDLTTVNLNSRNELAGISLSSPVPPSHNVQEITIDNGGVNNNGILADQNTNQKRVAVSVSTMKPILKLPELVQIIPPSNNYQSSSSASSHHQSHQHHQQQQQQHNQDQPDYEEQKKWIINNKYPNGAAAVLNSQDRPPYGPTSTTPFPREVVNPIQQSYTEKDPHTIYSEKSRPFFQLLSTTTTSAPISSSATTTTTTTTASSSTTTTTTTTTPSPPPAPLMPTTTIATLGGSNEPLMVTLEPLFATMSMFGNNANGISSHQTTLTPNQLEIQTPAIATESSFLQHLNETLFTVMATDFPPITEVGYLPSDGIIGLDSLSSDNKFDLDAQHLLVNISNGNQPPVPTILIKAKNGTEDLDAEQQQQQQQQQQQLTSDTQNQVMRKGAFFSTKHHQSPTNGLVRVHYNGGVSGGHLHDGSDEPLGQHSNNIQHQQQSLFDTSSNNGNNNSSVNRIPSECLECICEVSSNCDPAIQCTSKQKDKNRCGLYMITWDQYKESDIALTSFTTLAPDLTQEQQQIAEEKAFVECTTNKDCAERLIHLYIEKHERDCNGDGKINCYDVAALHRVGPSQCNSQKFLDSQYWKDFNGCYNMLAQKRKRSYHFRGQIEQIR